MAKAWTNKAHGNTHWAYIADIKTAWAEADLSPPQRRTIFMRFALGQTEEVIGAYEGVTKQSISERLFRGVGKMTAHLNGEVFSETLDPHVQVTPNPIEIGEDQHQ